MVMLLLDAYTESAAVERVCLNGRSVNDWLP